MKRFISFAFAAAVIISLTVFPRHAFAGFDNFFYSPGYVSGQFDDVAVSDWYSRYVEDACNYGFFRGKSPTSFDPGGLLTYGEALKLVIRFSCVFKTGSADFAEYDPFYAVYAEYALKNGIIESSIDYTAPATRSQFASLIYAALPPDALTPINSIPDNGICDVVTDRSFASFNSGGAVSADSVYQLYRAGIFTGADDYGSFNPEAGVTRAEACAIMVRLADPLARVKAEPPARIPAEIIYTRSIDAVFLLETFDKDGKSIRTGTGFFITDTGYAVTNLHVIDNAASAEVTLSNGDVFPVLGVNASSEDYNLIIFSVDFEKKLNVPDDTNSTDGSGSIYDPGDHRLSYLKLGDSDLAIEGSTVYALGNPLALVHTITDGIVANTYREVDGNTFFQFTAPISFGSGGSPVLNTLGQVVGVASSSFSYGQNMNLAVPANLIKTLVIGECRALDVFGG